MDDIIIKKKISKEELEKYDVDKWPLWSAPAETFSWEYEEKEICYILEGSVKVKYNNKEIQFSKGDLVIFPAGLNCIWEVIEPVKKVYNFLND